MRRSRCNGFSMIEILLVLAIIGILSGIAIPSYMGQRHRARMIGLVASNARIMSMQLEQYKSDQGTYGPANATASWVAGAAAPSLTGYAFNPCPGFTPSINQSSPAKLDFLLTVDPNGLAYIVNINDASVPSKPLLYQFNQTGQVLFQDIR